MKLVGHHVSHENDPKVTAIETIVVGGHGVIGLKATVLRGIDRRVNVIVLVTIKAVSVHGVIVPSKVGELVVLAPMIIVGDKGSRVVPGVIDLRVIEISKAVSVLGVIVLVVQRVHVQGWGLGLVLLLVVLVLVLVLAEGDQHRHLLLK